MSSCRLWGTGNAALSMAIAFTLGCDGRAAPTTVPRAVSSPDDSLGAEAPPETTRNEPAAVTPPVVCAPEYIDTQEKLDALEGCEIVTTGLVIAFDGADLRALHALRIAEEGITVGIGVGQIPSLEGLENLERARLTLEGVQVSDLRALANLRSLAPGHDEERPGAALTVADCPNLQSLEGLGQVPPLVHLTLAGNPLLTSLEPLQIAESSGALLLQNNPALTDLGALLAVKTAERIELRETALTTLDALSNLTRVDDLAIQRNALLSDISGVASLESVGSLDVSGNVALGIVPEFPRLTRVTGGITLRDNATLEAIEGFPLLTELGGDSGHLDIVDNPNLTRASAWPALEFANALVIQGNARLEEIAFESLKSVNQRLVIASNPLLSPAALAPLRAVSPRSVAVQPQPCGEPCTNE